ncbi:MAG: hypothetical protein BWY31_03995 [Lentisphaerae bacterium ADurb.Bin242]|nr:MAG: hypothetical protein BWY31_03995 [Lentisphaerae bacterium ADurb.Bin242]
MSEIPEKLQPWIDARKKYRLTHEQIQMARELGMKPSGLDQFAACDSGGNHSLSEYLGDCYRKRFKKDHPEDVRSIEERIASKKTRQTLKEGKRLGIADVAARLRFRFMEYFFRLKSGGRKNAGHVQIPAEEAAGQKKKSPRKTSPQASRSASKSEEETIAKFWSSITGLK